MTPTKVFLFGTLLYQPLLNAVVGRMPSLTGASLAGYSAYWAKDENIPILSEDPNGLTHGKIIEVTPEECRRLDFYEVPFGYTRRAQDVTTQSGLERVEICMLETGKWEQGRPWSVKDWADDNGELIVEAAKEMMVLCDTLALDRVARVYPMIKSRAASRIRAGREVRSDTTDLRLSNDGVDVDATRQPYTDYFAVREQDLSFPTFQGGKSATVTRAVFLGGDAVTVLPYDPVLDAVLLVQQFRYGVFARGDRQSWTVEPIAGRIDPGEGPEETAHREAAEEAGLTLSHLEQISRYYPSPSAYSEFLFSYVALADLAGSHGRIAGLDSEAEDIRSLIVTFNELMQMLASGEANTAPLILSAQWLALHRDRLRATV